MSIPLNSQQVLDREYLEIRGKIVELAASLDRLERAEGCVSDDNRMKLISQGLQILLEQADQTKAGQIQMLFSRVYEDNWRNQFDI
ncbi:MAG: hypothetical protein CMJ76_16855 [Planctomycetaceae bacterium]|nr:hypothetical protein [Planctomycetaceae bacterium]|tara:strand:- start:2288 stop:2545 length:258 start_codon:yes stop_codon:yes gene_type:complete